MNGPDDQFVKAAEEPPASDAGEDDVPSGNLFRTPKLTALDPADKKERATLERLLESLDEPA